MENKKTNNQRIIEQGASASRIFRGAGESIASQELYGNSGQHITSQLQKLFETSQYATEKNITLADLGSFKGELLSEISSRLKDQGYSIKTVAVDRISDVLESNPADIKVIGELDKIPAKSNSIDFAIMRYVLVWNPAEVQKSILKEAIRVTKGGAVIQHAGPKEADAEDWRAKFNFIFYEGNIPKLRRNSYCYFSSRDEIESWMTESGIKFSRLDEKVIPKLSESFVERFNLSSNDEKSLKEVLGDKDYIVRTTWHIFSGDKNEI